MSQIHLVRGPMREVKETNHYLIRSEIKQSEKGPNDATTERSSERRQQAGGTCDLRVSQQTLHPLPKKESINPSLLSVHTHTQLPPTVIFHRHTPTVIYSTPLHRPISIARRQNPVPSPTTLSLLAIIFFFSFR